MPPKVDNAEGAAGGAAAPDPVAAMAQAFQQFLANHDDNGQNRVRAISVKPPTFWTDRPVLWFAKLEAQFDIAGITVQKTKFNYVLQGLDNATIQEVATVAEAPQTNREYDSIKAALLEAFDQSQEAKDKALFALNGLGDRKPSSMLRHIRSLSTDLDTFVKAFFLAQLPVEVRSVLAAQRFTTVEEMAKAADRIVETRELSGCVAAVATPTMDTSTNPGAVAAVAKTKASDPFICGPHRKYGPKAHTCKPGCIWAGTPLAPRPPPPAGNAAATRQ